MRDLLLRLEDEVREANEIEARTTEGDWRSGDAFLAEDSVQQLDKALDFSDDSHSRQPSFSDAADAELTVNMPSAAASDYSNLADFR